MKFLLQTINGEISDIEVFNAKDIIKYSSYYIGYDFAELKDIKRGKEDYSDYIPIGTIPFVETWLKKYRRIDRMKPIEVPEVLRIERYLGRDYEIKSLSEIEFKGNKFIKDVDKLKQFSYLGNLESLDKRLLVSENYLISSVVNIMAEYRVFVDNTDIKAIQYYDGDCTVFPNVSILREMIYKYSVVRDRPKSYTMDIAVLKNGKTVIIEVHPVTSVGTYGFSSIGLLYMYKDGIDYYSKEI